MSETLVHFQSMPPMAAELTVEQEILLPDYLPGVFKILSAWLEPDLHWNRISENRIQLEGSAKLLVLYAADQDDQIHLAEHSAELSKTMELPAKEEEGEMQLSWQIQSCRLTAIPSDRRRIGCRGTVVVRIRQSCTRPLPLPEQFEGLECRRTPLEFCCRSIQGFSRFPVRDTLHLGAGEGTPERVIRACAQGICQDGKVLAGKAVVKGTIRLEVLWYCKQGNLHENTFELSVSQIVDLPGLEPEDCVQWQLFVNRCHVRPGEEEDPETLEVQLEVTACALAVGKRRLELVEDGYSTRYETHLTTASASVRQLVCSIHQTGTFRHTLSLQDAGITKLHCVLARTEPGALLAEEATVQAALSLCVVFTDESGVCRSVLSEVPMTLPLEGVEPNPSLQLEPVLVTRPISYHLSGEGQLELSLDWELQGLVFCSKTVTYLSVAQVDTDCPISQPEDLALKLLFPKAGESLWDIAKRCHTTLEGIRQANEGITEPLEPGTMLMVPIRSGRE